MPICRFLAVCIVAAAIWFPATAARTDAPAAETRLFVDDAHVANRQNVVRRSHACTKLPEPVLIPESPWEQEGVDKRIYIYGTVLRDPADGHFRMWYGRIGLVLYAESDDGLHWRRPNLGLCEWQNSTANNIVFTGVDSPSLVFNPEATPKDYRYAMMGSNKGYRFFHSADGMHWTPCSKEPPFKGGDTCTLAYDPDAGEYLAFHKRSHAWRGAERRLVYLSSSRDLSSWSDPVLVMAPDEADDEQVVREGGQFAQFYDMSVFHAGRHFLGLVTHFRFAGSSEIREKGRSRHDGPIDVQLAVSRDGRTWSRCEDRSPVIPNGPYPYDAGCILGVANGPVVVNDEWWLYYTAITGTHGAPLDKKHITIALAKWRVDGFVSLDAGETEGTVETVPLALAGKQLTVNADIAGTLRVAVMDTSGKTLPGYGFDDSCTLTGDSVRHSVRWKTHDRLPEQDRVILAFRMTSTKLYSFSVTR